MTRNIVFDMGGVILDFDGWLYIDRLGVPEEDRELLYREVFLTVEWAQMDRGIVTEDEAAASMCKRLPQRLHSYVYRLTGGWWKPPLTPVPGMGELIRELKGLGYGIYLLSNAGLCQPKYFHRLPGSECFDGQVISAQWKMLKPEREIYQVLFREYGLKPEECLFIDDLYINVEGALFAGMPAILFRGDVPRLRRELNDAGVPVKES